MGRPFLLITEPRLNIRLAWWIPRSYANFRLRLGYTQLSRVHPVLQGPVFRKPISTNPGLNFNLDFYTSLFDSLFGIIFSTLYGASNHQIVDKKNSTEFSLKASRAEIRFHTHPGLSTPSFEQPSPDYLDEAICKYGKFLYWLDCFQLSFRWN